MKKDAIQKAIVGILVCVFTLQNSVFALAPQHIFSPMTTSELQDVGFLRAMVHYTHLKEEHFFESEQDRAIRIPHHPVFKTIEFEFTKKEPVGEQDFIVPCIINRQKTYYVYVQVPKDESATFELSVHTKSQYDRGLADYRARTFEDTQEAEIVEHLRQAHTDLTVTPDITIADVGVDAGDHKRINKNIRTLILRGMQRVTHLRGIGNIEVYAIGTTDDMFIDEATGQRAHAGGIATVGGDNETKRIWIARGYFEQQRKAAVQRIMHESVELDLWWDETERLILMRRVRAPNATKSKLPTIREWIARNIEQAWYLQYSFHREAERRYPIEEADGADEEGHGAQATREVARGMRAVLSGKIERFRADVEDENATIEVSAERFPKDRHNVHLKKKQGFVIMRVHQRVKREDVPLAYCVLYPKEDGYVVQRAIDEEDHRPVELPDAAKTLFGLLERQAGSIDEQGFGPHGYRQLESRKTHVLYERSRNQGKPALLAFDDAMKATEGKVAPAQIEAFLNQAIKKEETERIGWLYEIWKDVEERIDCVQEYKKLWNRYAPLIAFENVMDEMKFAASDRVQRGIGPRNVERILVGLGMKDLTAISVYYKIWKDLEEKIAIAARYDILCETQPKLNAFDKLMSEIREAASDEVKPLITVDNVENTLIALDAVDAGEKISFFHRIWTDINGKIDVLKRYDELRASDAAPIAFEKLTEEIWDAASVEVLHLIEIEDVAKMLSFLGADEAEHIYVIYKIWKEVEGVVDIAGWYRELHEKHSPLVAFDYLIAEIRGKSSQPNLSFITAENVERVLDSLGVKEAASITTQYEIWRNLGTRIDVAKTYRKLCERNAPLVAFAKLREKMWEKASAEIKPLIDASIVEGILVDLDVKEVAGISTAYDIWLDMGVTMDIAKRYRKLCENEVPLVAFEKLAEEMSDAASAGIAPLLTAENIQEMLVALGLSDAALIGVSYGIWRNIRGEVNCVKRYDALCENNAPLMAFETVMEEMRDAASATNKPLIGARNVERVLVGLGLSEVASIHTSYRVWKEIEGEIDVINRYDELMEAHDHVTAKALGELQGEITEVSTLTDVEITDVLVGRLVDMLQVPALTEIAVTDIGIATQEHKRINEAIRWLGERYHEIVVIDGIEGIEVHVVGAVEDMYLDEASGQRTHAGGISTAGSEKEQRRIWVARGYYDTYRDKAIERIRHEAVELNLWWDKAKKMLDAKKIRAGDDTESVAPTMREWIGRHRERAWYYQHLFHAEAEKRYPVETTREQPAHSGTFPEGENLVDGIQAILKGDLDLFRAKAIERDCVIEVHGERFPKDEENRYLKKKQGFITVYVRRTDDKGKAFVGYYVLYPTEKGYAARRTIRERRGRHVKLPPTTKSLIEMLDAKRTDLSGWRPFCKTEHAELHAFKSHILFERAVTRGKPNLLALEDVMTAMPPEVTPADIRTFLWKSLNRGDLVSIDTAYAIWKDLEGKIDVVRRFEQLSRKMPGLHAFEKLMEEMQTEASLAVRHEINEASVEHVLVGLGLRECALIGTCYKIWVTVREKMDIAKRYEELCAVEPQVKAFQTLMDNDLLNSVPHTLKELIRPKITERLLLWSGAYNAWKIAKSYAIWQAVRREIIEFAGEYREHLSSTTNRRTMALRVLYKKAAPKASSEINAPVSFQDMELLLQRLRAPRGQAEPAVESMIARGDITIKSRSLLDGIGDMLEKVLQSRNVPKVIIRVIGDETDYYIDKEEKRQVSAEGLDTLGTDEERIRIWISQHLYKYDRKHALELVRHEAARMALWFKKGRQLIRAGTIRAMDERRRKMTIREWMVRHPKEAERLEARFKTQAEKVYPAAGPREKQTGEEPAKKDLVKWLVDDDPKKREIAIPRLADNYKDTFLKNAEDMYYLIRYLMEQLAGVRFTEFDVEDFKQEAIKEAYRALTDYYVKKPSMPGYQYAYMRIRRRLIGMALSGSEEDDRGKGWGAHRSSPKFAGTQMVALLEGMSKIISRPEEKLADTTFFPREWVFDTLYRKHPEIAYVITYLRQWRELSMGGRRRVLEAAQKIEAISQSATTSAERERLQGRIKKVLKTLSYREREILKLVHGLFDGYSYTLEETGNIFRVGTERIRQIQAKAEGKLKQPSRAGELVEFFPTERSLRGEEPLALFEQGRPAMSYQHVLEMFDTLSPIEARVLILLNGLLGGRPHTYEEVAWRLGISVDDVMLFQRTAVKKYPLPSDIEVQVPQKELSVGFDEEGAITFKEQPEPEPDYFGTAGIDHYVLPEPVRHKKRSYNLSGDEEDELLAWLEDRATADQRLVIPYLLRRQSVDEIVEATGRKKEIIEVEAARARVKLRLWLTLGALDRFGSREQVTEHIIALLEEDPLERLIRRNKLDNLAELTGDLEGVKEFIQHFYAGQYEEKDIEEALSHLRFSEIFPRARRRQRGPQERRPRLVLESVRQVVEQLSEARARRKKMVLKRLFRDFYYPFIRRDREKGITEGLDFLEREAGRAEEGSVWKEFLTELHEEYRQIGTRQLRGFKEKIGGRRRRQPLLPYQELSIYQALRTLEDPDEQCAWFASEARTGKTITAALAALNIRKPAKKSGKKQRKGDYAVRKLLVTAPNAAKYEFAEELRLRTSGRLGLKIFVIDRERGDREAQIKEAIRESKNRKSNVVIVANYEAAADFSELLSTGYKPDAHIIDEVENMRYAYRTVRAPLIFGIAATYRIGISARPVVKRPRDVIEGLLWLRQKRFHPEGMDIEEARARMRRLTTNELFGAVQPIFIRWRRQVVLPELKGIKERTIWVPYSKEQEEVIADMRRGYAKWKRQFARADKASYISHLFTRFDLERRASVDLRMAVKPARIKELVGELSDLDRKMRVEDQKLCPKVFELDKIIDQKIKVNGKIVVLVDFPEAVGMLVERYNRLLGDGAAVGVSGEVSVDDRLTGIRDFRSKIKNPKVLIGTTRLLGSSLNLFQMPGSPFHISTLVRLSRPWENYNDGERLVGIGQTHEVEVITLASKSAALKSIEEILEERLAVELEDAAHVVEGLPVMGEEGDEDAELAVDKFCSIADELLGRAPAMKDAIRKPLEAAHISQHKSNKGNVENCIRDMYKLDEPKSVPELEKIREMSRTTVDRELKMLDMLNLLIREGGGKAGDPYRYSLHPLLKGLTAEQIEKVCAIMIDIDGRSTRILYKADISAVAHRVQAKILETIQEMVDEETQKLTPAVPHGKVLWHVVAHSLIPQAQKDMGFATQVNQMSRRSDSPERIRILNECEDLETVLKHLSADPNNIVHVIVNTNGKLTLDAIPETVKVAIMKGEVGNYTQFEGILAVSRALDIEDSALRNEALRGLYKMLTGEEFKGTIDGTDHKTLALSIVFTLPKIVVIDTQALQDLNKSLLKLIQSA